MELIKLRDKDINEFKRLMQESFQYGYESIYGSDKEQVLPDKDIDENLNNPNSHAFEMIDNNEIVGGVIVTINENNINHLDFLFVKVRVQSKGIGQMIWKEIEKLYPNTEVWETCTPYFDKRNIHFYVNRLKWETCTPYFDKRNIHFYVNRLKFHIVEYFNEKHPDTNRPLYCYEEDDGMFRFEKVMK